MPGADEVCLRIKTDDLLDDPARWRLEERGRRVLGIVDRQTDGPVKAETSFRSPLSRAFNEHMAIHASSSAEVAVA